MVTVGQQTTKPSRKKMTYSNGVEFSFRFVTACVLSILILNSVSVIHSTTSLADDASPTPESSPGPEYDEVCGHYVTDKCEISPTAYPSQPSGSTYDYTSLEQKANYCVAACNSQTAFTAHVALAVTWGAAAAVCTAACAAKISGKPMNEWVCNGANLAAGAADSVTTGIITKDMTQALIGFGTAAGSTMMNMVLSGAPLNGKPKEEVQQTVPANGTGEHGKQIDLKDAISCVTMVGLPVSQVVMKTITAVADKKALDANVASAAAVSDVVDGYDDTVTSLGLIEKQAQTAAEAAKMTTGTTTDSSTTEATTSADCSNALSSGASMLSCSAAMDGGVGSFVSNPKFPEQVKKATGLTLDELAGISQSDPSAGLLASMGTGMMGADAMAKVKEDLSKLTGDDLHKDEIEGMYKKGGGGRGRSGGGDEFSSMMGGLLGKFLPGGGGANKAGGVQAVVFALSKSRNPASLAENKDLSLFDRVSFQYMKMKHDKKVGGE